MFNEKFVFTLSAAAVCFYLGSGTASARATFQADTLLRAPAATCDFYAAPDGTPKDRGTLARPWDLQTALNQPAALKPGATLCLRGGTYTGLFVSNLNGKAGQKITVRSTPGEWAVLDGYVSGVLASPIAADAATLPLVDASRFPSAALLIDAMLGTDGIRIYGRSGNTLTVYDNLSTAHPQGTIVVARGATLTVNGSHVVVRDFEILNSNPSRTDTEYYNRTVGLNMYAPESLVLNLVVHDTLQGLGFWEQARNSIACGNILYNNGQVGNGHGIYTQNEVGTKLLCDNITFGNFGLGMQMYTTNGGTQTGFTWDGNVNVNNGYLFGGQKPMDDLTITNNFLYGATLALGYGDAGPHGRAVVTGNYVYAEFPFSVVNWTSVAVTNNKFYGMPTNSGTVIRVNLPVNGLIGNYTFANNDYLFGRSWQDAPFILKVGAADTEYQLSSWQTLVGDTTSTYRGATQQSPTVPRPTGLDLFYRANAYEVGRGNIIIYNYDGASQVSLDLARLGLPIGQSYQIRNGQDFTAPPITVGTYSGGSVSVSLNALAVAQPFTDNGERNLDTCPNFCVLVVVPQPGPTGQDEKGHVNLKKPAAGQVMMERDSLAPPATVGQSGSQTGAPVNVDLDGDGDGDVLAWNPGWTVMPAQFDADALTDYFLFNTESGEWVKMIGSGSGFTSQASGAWRPGWMRHLMDLDGDGISDLFLYDASTGEWFKAISTPNGFSYEQGRWNPGWEIYPMTLNADTMDDLFLINRSTGRWFWALGELGAGFSYPVTESWFPGWTLYPGDFNGDGLTDLLLHDPQTGTIFVATTGASGFTYKQGGWSLGWTPVVTDLDADGRDDLFLHAVATGQWLHLISNGNGSFTNAGGQMWRR